MLVRSWLLGVAAVALLTGCATQRYGRLTPVSGAERQLMTCHDIEVEAAKSQAFLDDVRQQRSTTTGAHVLGFLGDFGIGNVMEGDAAEQSGQQRLQELRDLAVQKGCSF